MVVHKKARDSQRKRLYKAEKAVPSVQKFFSVWEVQQYVNKITQSKYWANNSPTAVVIVTDGRGRKKGGAVTKGGVGYIKMPQFTRYDVYILHELAHIMSPPSFTKAGHGPEYCRVYLSLVKEFMGPTSADLMRVSFKEHKIKLGCT
jgi:putative metallohydrolase (TIGR04338 family)